MFGQAYDGIDKVFGFLMICFIILIGVGAWGIFDFFFIEDNVYRVKKKIEPKIEIIVDQYKTDTTYVYKF
jgi:hypothetical protein